MLETVSQWPNSAVRIAIDLDHSSAIEWQFRDAATSENRDKVEEAEKLVILGLAWPTFAGDNLGMRLDFYHQFWEALRG